MKKLVLNVVLIFFIVQLFAVQASAEALSDIPDKYSGEVNYLLEKGILTGYPDGEFKPNKQVTREEAATMIGRALNLDGTVRKSVFYDVRETSYASGYIQSAYEKDIIDGYGNGTYGPLKEMTRLEMAYLISKAFQLNETSSITYKDSPSNANHQRVIDLVSTAGISTGYPGNVFKPNNSITRVEFSIMLARALNPEFKPEIPEPPTDEPVDPTTMYVTADVLNVRKGPGTNYDRVGQVVKNDAVTVLAINGSWAKISTSKINEGYVHTDYLTDKKKVFTIMIDAGHGGKDPGASGNGVVEKEVNLDVSLKLRDYLKKAGYNVLMIRTNDTFVELDDRVFETVKSNADLFISIHSNSHDNPSANGTETYYSATGTQYVNSLNLAKQVQSELVKALATTNRGVKNTPFRVIKDSKIPAILVELGFVTNSHDANKLASQTYRDKAAKAISQGVENYLK
ncbi:N-acetylmuramoyl-L-alanine amidase [Ornithinibacillus scapharcae]|uniref:N-acetylmuramoyl-L-alanine amidase n=1 Tax=Ornithinibacillus scapharcae TaxID=1147159 RepID=UPI001300C398|nr:N-acetylmuramoyl-L-alanine amidase [Ornithinibacillus scapharcae]